MSCPCSARNTERRGPGKKTAEPALRPGTSAMWWNVIARSLLRLPENVPAIDPKKIAVAGNRPPGWGWVLQQLGQRYPSDFSRALPHRPGVIHHNRPFAGRPTQAAGTDKDHGVIRRVLRKLAVEKQITGASQPHIARYQKGIEAPQGLGVSKFSK